MGGMVASSDELWIVDAGCKPNPEGSLLEINARTGRSVHSVSSSAGRYGSPDSVLLTSSGIWVANSTGGIGQDGEIVVLNLGGQILRTIRAGLNSPQEMVAVGGMVWVVDGNTGWLTQFDASSGALVRVIR